MASGDFQLNIQTIYTERPSAPVEGRASAIVLGLVTTLVGLAWLYLTWFPMYRWVEQKVAFGMINIPSTIMNRHAADTGQPTNPFAGLMGPPPRPVDKSGKPVNFPKAAEQRKAAEAMNAEIQRATRVLQHCMGWWLGIASLAGFLLVVGGVAGGFYGSGVKRGAGLVLLACVLVGVAVGWYGWHRYQFWQMIMPRWLVPTLLGLAITAAGALGAMINTRARFLLRLSAVMVILSAAASVAAIYVAVRWAEMPAESVNRGLYSRIFGVQSAYGWLLLIVSFWRR